MRLDLLLSHWPADISCTALVVLLSPLKEILHLRQSGSSCAHKVPLSSLSTRAPGNLLGAPCPPFQPKVDGLCIAPVDDDEDDPPDVSGTLPGPGLDRCVHLLPCMKLITFLFVGVFLLLLDDAGSILDPAPASTARLS